MSRSSLPASIAGGVAAAGERPRGLVRICLGVATLAMGALHVVQPELDPLEEPISFYVHGKGGVLLVVALIASAVAAIGLTRARDWSRGARRMLVAFGVAMALTAAVPSDQWFPWELPPTWHGVVHAALAVVAPSLLPWPMYEDIFRREARWPVSSRVVGVLYIAALLGCGVSLGVGFFEDRAPPLIGLGERVLAVAAVVWVFLATRADVGSSRAKSAET